MKEAVNLSERNAFLDQVVDYVDSNSSKRFRPAEVVATPKEFSDLGIGMFVKRPVDVASADGIELMGVVESRLKSVYLTFCDCCSSLCFRALFEIAIYSSYARSVAPLHSLSVEIKSRRHYFVVFHPKTINYLSRVATRPRKIPATSIFLICALTEFEYSLLRSSRTQFLEYCKASDKDLMTWRLGQDVTG